MADSGMADLNSNINTTMNDGEVQDSIIHRSNANRNRHPFRNMIAIIICTLPALTISHYPLIIQPYVKT